MRWICIFGAPLSKCVKRWNCDRRVPHHLFAQLVAIGCISPILPTAPEIFVCMGCDTYFLLNVLYCNATLGELSPEERKMISTRDGRLSEGWYLDGTVVQVREEGCK